MGKLNGLRKVNIKIIIAIILAIISLYFLYEQFVPKEVANLSFEKYVKANKTINADELITEDMLEYDELPSNKIPKAAIRDIDKIVGKYASGNILKDEIIRTEKIKNEIESEYFEEEREVRIYTNVQAYGGVGPGDRADLIFTEEFNDIGKIGIIKYEGVLVKKVLNDEGIDIENVTNDKYSQGSLKPYIVVLTVNQDMAFNIETLQRDQNVNFKLIKWTERSKKQNTEDKILYLNQILSQESQQETVVKEED